jgi:DNA-binding XRE family transcriptional regulator
MSTEVLIEENPIRICRKALHMTQAKFANEVGIHESAVLLNEQGCYHEILPKILEYLVEQDYDPKQLQRDYLSFVSMCRKYVRSKLSLDEFRLGDQFVTLSPIHQLYRYMKMNRTKIAKLICVQPALLYKVEHGESTHLPSQVELALRDVGVRELVLAQMNEQQDEFTQWLKVNR